jgi:hypothetical protein
VSLIDDSPYALIDSLTAGARASELLTERVKLALIA